ncbi:MAG TPA: FAD-dependent oxidoreductase [Longimicrobiaceae bacterium]|nr:FAD-dependent oxidoreductase [Longimicrobiaceae bacterium]
MSDQEPIEITNPRLDDAEIQALASYGRRRSLHDGDPLFRAGDRRGGFYIVLKGAIEVLDRSGDEPRRIAIHGPGQFTGDIDILTRRRPVVGAIARGETEVFGVSSGDVRRIIDERPRLGDTILRAFIARREELLESGFEGLRLIGSGASRESFQMREFLSRNQVPFTWIDVEEESGVADTLADFGIAEADLPVVAYAGDPLMRNPSIREVADALGLRRPIRSEPYDLVIVGAGPAGLAAAVYGASEGLATLVLEGVAPGGQAGASTKIENYLGFPTGITGADLTGRATLQAQKFGAELSSPAPVSGMEVDGDYPVIQLETGERAAARCVLIATGADYSKLDVPDRERFDGVGIYYAATPTELTACAGSDVVVVGGGNSAGQAVMFLSEHTRRVQLLVRSGDLRKSMSSYLAGRVEAAENVEVLCHTEVRQVLGDDRLNAVVVENTRTGESRTIRTPGLFSFIGAVPRTTWLPPQIETGPKGFIRTGRAITNSVNWRLQREPYLLETSHPGVFAAGDVRLGSIPRVSSAVGEGAMAVKFVHAYLAEQSAPATA